jgi:hypothetical protein
VTAWADRYRARGLVVVGVHTPEFAFEKDTGDVSAALARLQIHYPVAQDNDFGTWSAFKNHYWPAEYLIDTDGRIRLAHFGEGRYDEMERAIRRLLAATGPLEAEPAPVGRGDGRTDYELTPETYLGLGRLERFASPEAPAEGRRRFSLPASLPADSFAFQGSWELSKESARARQGSALELNFSADQVFLVMSPRRKGDRVSLFLDGKRQPEASAGADVQGGGVALDTERLYRLVDLKGLPGRHRLRLEFQSDGIAVYAFTFG